MSRPVPIPSLDELAERPELVRELPPRIAEALAAQVAGLHTRLVIRAQTANGARREEPEGDRLLGVEEAASKLRVSKDYVYRNASRLPFTVRIGRQLRFSQHGIAKYIRQRIGCR